MAKLEKTITINAPVEKVCDYINEPTNLPEVWPSMVEAKDVQRLPNGGTSFRFTYKAAGILLESTSEDTEYVANQRMVSKSKGGIEDFVEKCKGQSPSIVVSYHFSVAIARYVRHSSASQRRMR